MTDRVSLEAAVRNEPEGFEDRIDEIHERLASADPHASADAGRTFRSVAEERPALLETHRGTLVDLLSADNGSLRLSGALGLAGLANPSPETVTEAVPELVALLERTDAPAVQMAILRALSRTGERARGGRGGRWGDRRPAPDGDAADQAGGPHRLRDHADPGADGVSGDR